jgi:hypothetical protein
MGAIICFTLTVPFTAFARQEMKSITFIKSEEGRIMKATIIIIIISVALLVTGILYGEHPQMDHANAVTLDEAYAAQFTEQMPDFVVEPMSSFPVF